MRACIGTVGWVNQERAKLGVIRLQFGWYVISDRGTILQKRDGNYAKFPTHAEAITYAYEQATIQAVAKHFTIPPESPAARAMKEPTC